MQYSIQGFTDPSMACDVKNGKCSGSGGSGKGGGGGGGSGGGKIKDKIKGSGGGKRSRGMSDYINGQNLEDINLKYESENEGYEGMDGMNILVFVTFGITGLASCYCGLQLGRKLQGHYGMKQRNNGILPQ